MQASSLTKTMIISVAIQSWQIVCRLAGTIAVTHNGMQHRLPETGHESELNDALRAISVIKGGNQSRIDESAANS